MLTHDAVVVVKGRVNRRDDTPSIYASDLTLPDLSEGPRGPVVVTMDTNRATSAKVEELKSVLAAHPGSTEVHVRLSQPGRSVLMRLEDSYRVQASEALFGDLKVILGPRCLTG
jgi:DNA polymerase-3 subunit alpha